MKTHFDAIVVGSGISGGWAAKELCEKGLKTLVLERGRMVKHIEDYPTMNLDPWDMKHGGSSTQEDLKNYKALSAEVLEGKFQGQKIYALYLPSFGAITIQILQILDHLMPAVSEEDLLIRDVDSLVASLAYVARPTEKQRMIARLSSLRERLVKVSAHLNRPPSVL